MAAELLARLVADDGRVRRARKVLERTWQVAPHPALAAAYLDILGTAPPLDRYRAISQLTKDNRDHPESRFAVAEAAVVGADAAMRTHRQDRVAAQEPGAVAHAQRRERARPVDEARVEPGLVADDGHDIGTARTRALEVDLLAADLGFTERLR